MKRFLAMSALVLLAAGIFAVPAYAVDGAATGRLNINTATQDELAWFLLRNGVGRPVQRAGSIVAYRQENGPFDSVGEILNVEGIGEFELNRILPWIKVSGRSDYRPKGQRVLPDYPYTSPAYPRDGPSEGAFPHDEPYGPWRTRP